MLEMNELLNQQAAELKEKYDLLSGEIYSLKSELKIAKKLDKPHELRDKKRDRARVLTALNKKH